VYQPFTVNTGDFVEFSIQLTHVINGLNYYTVHADDSNTGAYAEVTTSTAATWHYADMGVFEAFNISACNQLPAQVEFKDVTLYEGPLHNYTNVTPNLSTDDACSSPNQCAGLSGTCACNATFHYVSDFASYLDLNQ
jgi:hypothetical protein